MTSEKKEKPKKKNLTRWQQECLDGLAADRRQFHYERKKERLATTELYQRRAFIESLRRGETFGAAMKNAGIEDHWTAILVWQKNSRPVTHRVLVDPEKVR